MWAGRYWMLLRRVLDDRGELVHVGGSEVSQAVFNVRPGAIDGVQIGGAGGQPHLGQPARRASMKAHIAALTWVFKLSQIRTSRADSCPRAITSCSVSERSAEKNLSVHSLCSANGHDVDPVVAFRLMLQTRLDAACQCLDLSTAQAIVDGARRRPGSALGGGFLVPGDDAGRDAAAVADLDAVAPRPGRTAAPCRWCTR